MGMVRCQVATVGRRDHAGWYCRDMVTSFWVGVLDFHCIWCKTGFDGTSADREAWVSQKRCLRTDLPTCFMFTRRACLSCGNTYPSSDGKLSGDGRCVPCSGDPGGITLTCGRTSFGPEEASGSHVRSVFEEGDVDWRCNYIERIGRSNWTCGERATVHVQMRYGDLVPVRGLRQRCAVVCSRHAAASKGIGAEEVPFAEMVDLSYFKHASDMLDRAVVRTETCIAKSSWDSFRSTSGVGELNALGDGSLVLTDAGGGFQELPPVVTSWGTTWDSHDWRSGRQWIGREYGTHQVMDIALQTGILTIAAQMMPRWTAWLREHYPDQECSTLA